jgi:hypothetical protein
MTSAEPLFVVVDSEQLRWGPKLPHPTNGCDASKRHHGGKIQLRVNIDFTSAHAQRAGSDQW